MAYLFADGLDWLVAVADLSMRWDAAPSGGSLVAAANTAFSVGGALQLGTGTISNINKTLGANESTIYINFRSKFTGTSGGATQGLQVGLLDGSTGQCGILFRQDGSISVFTSMSNSTVTAISGTVATATGLRTMNSWDSWQIKVVIHNTTGSIEVRKNGSSTATASWTGINTRNGTANAYANKIGFGCGTSSSGEQLDDIFVCSSSGAAPNTWPGDLRAVSQSPNATPQSQFAVTGGASAHAALAATENADASYVASSTVGHQDFYSFPAVTTTTGGATPASVVGVVPFVIAKKSDSGARTIDVTAKSGATESTVFTSASVGLSYTVCGGFLGLDPATGAAWTVVALDAMQLGPKVSA